MAIRFLLLGLVFITGCGVGTVDVNVGEDTLETDEALLAGDKADHSCQVVLRNVQRAAGTGGFATNCTPNGPCYFVWEGFIDVALTAKAGAKAYVLYRPTDATVWSKKQATAATGGPAGYQRYKFKLDTNTVNAGMSSTSLQRARIDLSPYLLTQAGARLFDHNRLPGNFDVYSMTVDNGWTVNDDAAVCRPDGLNKATVQFTGAFQTVQHGALAANGKLNIDYDLNRLQACRGTHNGYPAFDITAFVRFSPGNQKLEQSVRTFDTHSGTPVFSTLHAQPFEVTIPSGSTSAEVWFVNTGLWCSPSYDSNNGANYRFDVISPLAPVQWFGNSKSSTSRDCVANQNVPDSITLDGYIRERACSFVESQVYVPGLTDGSSLRPELVMAKVESKLDGVAQPMRWLTFQSRTGNNYTYRYEVPRDTLYYGSKWTRLEYTISWSTDGVIWVDDIPREVKRDVTWCNPAWGSCAL